MHYKLQLTTAEQRAVDEGCSHRYLVFITPSIIIHRKKVPFQWQKRRLNQHQH